MSYERQYYTNGDVLEASHLNHMEAGIKENSDSVSKLSEEKVSNPSIGEVGQILEIETVDEDGKPLTYKAVNKPTGGEVSDEQIAEAVENYLTENPIEGGGADGEDGVGIRSVEQTTTSTEDGGANIITVTKTDGTSSTFQVLNGSKGSQGEQGEKGDTGATGASGYTPVKGIDYFTEEEIANQADTIKDEVVDKFLNVGKLKDSDNHFNYTGITVGYRVYASADNGYVAESNSAISNRIEVKEGNIVYINNLPLYTSNDGLVRRIAFYDENELKLSEDAFGKIPHGSSQFSMVIPTSAKYMIFDVYSTITNVDFIATLDYTKIMVTFDMFRDYAEYVAPVESDNIIINVQNLSPTKDKQMLIFGDSITETATMDDDGSNYVEGIRVNWMSFAKNYLQTDNFKNYAKSGGTYMDISTGTGRQLMVNQLTLAMADQNNDNAEIIVISLGTNDGDANDDYDTAMAVETIEELDRTKFHQAVRYAMWSIKIKYPNAKCFVATPIQKARREQPSTLRKAIISMANRYNFKVIDAEFESGIVRDNEVIDGEGVDLYDGLHPNENGARKMAVLYSSVIINSFIQDYEMSDANEVTY